MTATTTQAVALKPASQALVEGTAKPPFPYELTRDEARKVLHEGDVLRDEGEAYARRRRATGVAVGTVRYAAITHDFMILNPLSRTHATRAAMAQAAATPRQALHAA